MKGFLSPIGSEQVSGGYVYRKTTEQGPSKKWWRRAHLVNWEAAHGPLPEDYVLKCLDGNKLNTAASNWEAVPKGLLIHLDGTARGSRPAYGTAPAELKPAILAAARLKHKMLRTAPTTAQRSFLELLKTHKTTTRKHLPPATPTEEVVRASCKYKGWAKFSRWKGDTALGWRLTARGRAALAKVTGEA
jgi:hypothetical protein